MEDWRSVAAGLATAGAAAAGAWIMWRGGSKGEIMPGMCVETREPKRKHGGRARSAVVVGAGIVGLSVARELARRGVQVTVLERASQPGSVATAASWAWLNANGKQPLEYQHLNMMAMRAWELSLPGLASWVGGLIISSSGDQAEPSYATPALSPEQMRDVCPAVDLASSAELGYHPAEHQARHYPQEGLVEVEDAIAYLICEAKEMGARIIYGVEVTGYPWDVEGDIVGVCYRDACVPDGTTASGGVLPRGPSREKAHEIRADVTVLCNGTGVEALARKAGYSVRMVPRPGMLAHARLSPGAGDNGRLGKIVVTPWLHMLQRGDGRVVIGETAEKGGASSGAYAVKDERAASSDSHGGSQRAGGSVDAEKLEKAEFGERMLRRAHLLAPRLMEGAEVERVTKGWRPMPADGLPAIGFLESSCATRRPSLYVCVMHSGVTLGPLTGALAAFEIAGGGREVACLSPFRPGRAELGRIAERREPLGQKGWGCLAMPAVKKVLVRAYPSARGRVSACSAVCKAWRDAVSETLTDTQELDLAFGNATPWDLSRLLRLFGSTRGGVTILTVRGCKNITGQTLCDALGRDAASASITSLDMSLLEGCGGRVPSALAEVLPGLKRLTASGCGLKGSLSRVLPARMASLAELDVSGNSLDDVASALTRLLSLEVLDLRGNTGLWDAALVPFGPGGFGAGRGRAVQKNAHAVTRLMERGVVVLLDSGGRAPSCPCCV